MVRLCLKKLIMGHIVGQGHELLAPCKQNFEKIPKLIFYQNGRGSTTPLRMTQHCWEKNLKFFIDHKLLDGEGILIKYPTLIFAKNGGGQFFWEYFSKFILDNIAS